MPVKEDAYYLKNTALVLYTCHRRFQEWNKLDIFNKMWIKLLKVYDKEVGINWTWQSIDSISIKATLWGPRQEIIPLQIGANWAQKDTF